MRIRTRLLGVSIAVLGLGLGLLLVLGNLLFAHTIEGVTARLLVSRADAQIAALVVSPSGVRVRHAVNDTTLDAHSWIFSAGRVLERPAGVSPALDRAARSLGRRGVAAEVDAPAGYRLRSVPLRAGRPAQTVGAVVVETSVAPFDSLRRTVLFGSLAVAALVLLAAALAIDRALRGALGPVQAMTEAAEDWSEHDLDRRFALGCARDEIGGLAVTLDRLLERIAASRRHERRFAGDVAHELRTPLAAIRGRAEFAADARAADDERVQALGAISDQAARMGVTIDTLLAVARQEIEPRDGQVDVEAVAGEFEAVSVRVTGPVRQAEGDPAIVRRALAPLVDNARRHARSSVTLTVVSTGATVSVEVRDDGPGLPPGLGEAAFEPGRRDGGANAGAAGLGLPLARRLARACGGDVVLGGGPGGCFVLELPASGPRTPVTPPG